ncbi:hypothetical protein IFM89_019094 [Coptis chinensis]|uniref:RRM domain-containing protein n=1 Tax=Coptis chinensis TaxID=261450 RepID=A0A835HN95_9MAGN|nr:hypothetical protein IFM89_019094 [Coptis chinensis]
MAEEASMVELEEQVDLDSDNYNEEMDDEVEETLEEDRVEVAEEDDNDEQGQQPLQTEDLEENHLPESDGDHDDADESVEDEQKPTESVNEEDKEKHAELLALPPHGAEVFIGGLPRDVTEGDLRDLCEPIGEVTEIKLIKDKDTGESKGFSFITFKKKEFAQKAIEEFQSKEFRGRTLRCSLSQTKYRLFMGNIPKQLTEKELRAAIEKTSPGVESIDLVKVKALYVKNLPGNATTEKLKELFRRHGEVTKVVLPPGKSGQSKREFGYIHYAERSSALKAVKETEVYELEGQVLDVCLAKPQNEKKYEQVSYPQAQIFPSYLPQPSYGFVGDPYGALGSGYGAPTGYQQPMIYGRGPMPSGMQMVPMVLPDGQIGYVLQQPEAQAPPPLPRRHERRNDRGSGSHGHGSPPGRGDGSRGRRYRPY